MGEYLAWCISMIKDKSILINNIYHMLAYAFQTLSQGNYEDVAVESFDEIYDLFADILAKGIGVQLKQSYTGITLTVRKNYRSCVEKSICQGPTRIDWPPKEF